MKRVLCIGASVAAMLLWAHAATAQPQPLSQVTDSVMTLEAVLEQVRARNASLRAMRLGAAANATRAAQVSALPDPLVTMIVQPMEFAAARGGQRSQWRIEQQFPFPGKRMLRGRMATLGAEEAAYRAAAFEADLEMHAKHAYFELYRVQQHQARILAFQSRLDQFATDARAQYEVGLGPQQAILHVQLQRSLLFGTLLALNAEHAEATETLAALMERSELGRSLGALRVGPPPLLVQGEAAMLALALARRPEHAALKAAAKSAESGITLARKALMPDFGVRLSYFDVQPHDAVSWARGRDAFAIGLSVRVPLQRGRLDARIEEAQLTRQRVAAESEALHTSIQTSIAELVRRLDEAQEQLALLEEVLIPLATTTRQATLNAYATGTADYAELLEAEKTLFTLGTSYEDVLALCLKTIASLERTLGVRSLRDVEQTTTD